MEELLDTPGVGYLSEVMDYPGVLAGDRGVLGKVAAALRRGLPVDGHAPGLTGDDARRYAAAGITTINVTPLAGTPAERVSLVGQAKELAADL